MKRARVAADGAEIVTVAVESGAREQMADRLVAERGLVLIPPYDDDRIIAGQGTAARELFEEVGQLDFLFVCCGGAGLLSGSALAASRLAPAATGGR